MPLDEFGNLVGKYEHLIQRGTDAYLLFKFPKMKVLKIRSGANSINWSYELNTAVTPTIGGEVIQILSCFVGPMTIEGMAAGFPTEENVPNQKILSTPTGWGNQTTPADEMVEIVDWFRDYMHLAGAIEEGRERRVERAIHFLYPKRGWDFYIQVTGLEGFAMDTSMAAVPWRITAEVVSDNGLEFMEASTMGKFTSALVGRDTLFDAISDGYEFQHNPFVNPSLDSNILNAKLIKQMGDNFQDLVAAWSSGDFHHFGYSSILLDTKKNKYRKNVDGDYFDNPYDVYTDAEWFGGQGAADGLDAGYFLGTGPLKDYNRGIGWGGVNEVPGGGEDLPDDGEGGGGGGGGEGEVGCGANECQIVNRINFLFEQAGMPGKLGVATSIYESGLRPEAANSGGHVGLFQNNVIGTGRASVPQAITDLWRAHPNDDPLIGACKAYPIDLQITQASQWFPRYKPDSISAPYSDAELHHWATCAQGVGGSPCDPNNSQFSLSTFTQYLREAEKLIARCAEDVPPTTGACATLVSIALAEVGTAEDPIGSNWGHKKGPTGKGSVAQYLSSVGWTTPAPWCGAFMSWVFQQYGVDKSKLPGGAADVTAWVAWASPRGWLIGPSSVGQLRQGDLVIYNPDGGDEDHINMVSKVNDNGTFNGVGGNQGSPNAFVTNTPRTLEDVQVIIRHPFCNGN